MIRLALAAILVSSYTVPQKALPKNLDRYVEDVRGEWGVVGLAVAVVKDGRVVYARGFGETKLGSGEGVDENTLFAIGSNTKAFTAAAIGILVDEKKMGWDDRVTAHLPWFALWDPYVTREITVRDLLSHRSGLGRRGDFNWYASDFDREEIVRRVRFLEPNSSFRSEAGYQNTMFLAAGEVLEEVGGESWDDFVRARLLGPLGMARSRTSVRDLEGLSNVAQPHEKIDGKVVPVPHRNIDNVAPAGSILSSASEMTRWMLLMLGEGELEGKRILSKESAAEVFEPNIMYPMSAESKALFPSTHFSTYGLGWGLRDYRGRLVATHSGGIDGMLSQNPPGAGGGARNRRPHQHFPRGLSRPCGGHLPHPGCVPRSRRSDGLAGTFPGARHEAGEAAGGAGEKAPGIAGLGHLALPCSR